MFELRLRGDDVSAVRHHRHVNRVHRVEMMLMPDTKERNMLREIEMVQIDEIKGTQINPRREMT
jgi:hypothetical protein